MYKRKMSLSLMAFLSLLSLLNPLYSSAFEATSGGTAVSVPLADKDAKQGDIISYQSGQYLRSAVAYDPQMIGVLTDTPSVAYTDTTLENARYVVSEGLTLIRVSTANGEIKKGDLITSSPQKGVGQKAVDYGYIIGSAQEDFTGPGVGTIQALLHPELGKGNSKLNQNLFSTIKLGLAAPGLTPINAMRYLLAALIVLSSFVLGFVFFGRASSRGVEAIGRNPLAKKMIMTTVLVNVGLTLLITLVGVVIAYLILVL